jgi:Domain of unknown function (DUF2019)
MEEKNGPSKLVSQCVDSAVKHGVAAYEVVTDPRKTNRFYDETYKLFKELKASGHEGIEALRKLLDHPDEYVRVKAAIFLLSVDTNKARNILQETSCLPGIFGFSTALTLKEWDKGKLRDYYA